MTPTQHKWHPLSYSQQRLWMFHQIKPQSVAYNLGGLLWFKGNNLNKKQLLAALSDLAEQTPSLNLIFDDSKGEPLQRVDHSLFLGSDFIDLSHMSQNTNIVDATTWIEQDAQERMYKPYNLKKQNLTRSCVYEISNNHFAIFLGAHHLIMDGWSLSLCCKKLLNLLTGKGKAGKNSGSSYLEFATQRVSEEDLKRSQQHWRALNLLGDTPLELPVADVKSDLSYSAGHIENALTESETQKITEAAKSIGVTRFELLSSALLLTLSSYANNAHPSIIVPALNRDSKTRRSVGFYVNNAVLGMPLSPLETLEEISHKVQRIMKESVKYSALPIEQLGEQADGQSTLSLPTTAFNFRAHGSGLLLSASDFQAVFKEFPVVETPFELVLDAISGDQLSLRFVYAKEKFTQSFIHRFISSYKQILAEICSSPTKPKAQLSIITAEDNIWLDKTSAIRETYSPTIFTQLLTEQALLQPDAIAIQHNAETLTYAQLDKRSNQLAHFLAARSPSLKDNVIGVMMERGTDMLIAMIGVMKAGAAFLPLDPDYPSERLGFMLKDSQSLLLLTQQHLFESAQSLTKQEIIALSSLLLEDLPDTEPNANLHPNNLAYLIYTSGSTGTPKGVAVDHLGLTMHIQTIGARYGMTPDDCELHFASISFDGAVERWTVPLAFGSRLIIRDQELWTPEKTTKVLCEENVTIACFPPSYMGPLLDWIEETRPSLALRSITLGGEAFTHETFERIKSVINPPRIINGYGPTETVVTPMIWSAENGESFTGAYAPIGTAVGERKLYVLDENLSRLPVGSIGELYIGMEVGLARGYFNRPDITAERFLPDPFANNGERMYRTGDLVSFRQDGVVEYLGRADQQIKIRGFRIELGEIESRLQAIAGSELCAVVAHKAHSGTKLIAYIQLNNPEQAQKNDWLAQLAEQVPDYMVPVDIITHEKLPLTPAGKIDRTKLANLEWQPKKEDSEFSELTTNKQKLLANIWCELLSLDSVGADSHFFALGGDSIMALQLVGKLRQKNLLLTPKEVFDQPTLAEMADRLTESVSKKIKNADQHVLPSGQNSPVPLLPMQARFIQQLDHALCNQYMQFHLADNIDPNALRHAVALLVSHHDALRLKFSSSTDTANYADINANEPLFSFQVLDNPQGITESTATLVQTSISPSLGRNISVGANTSSGEVIIAVHHLVVDALSWLTLVQDLIGLYTQNLTLDNSKYLLPQKTHHQADWHQALNGYSLSTKEQQYWNEQVSDSLFPNKRGEITSLHCQIDTGTANTLFEQTKRFAQLDKETSLLAAISCTLAKLTGKNTFTVHKESHGRYSEQFGLDLSHSINWFTALFPHKINIHDELGLTLGHFKDLAISVTSGGIGYSAGVVQKHWSYSDSIDVLFNYLGSATNTKVTGIEVSKFGLWRNSNMPAETGITFNISENEQGLSLDIELDSNISIAKSSNNLIHELKATILSITNYCLAHTPTLTKSDAPHTELSLATLAKVSQHSHDNKGALPQKVLPLSTLQQGLYFHAKLSNSNNTYVNQITLPIRGASSERLIKYWQSLMERHAILRTTISQIDGQAYQVTWPELALNYKIKDTQHTLSFDLESYKSQLIQQGFKLEQALDTSSLEALWRIDLVQTTADELQCIFTIHHILMDGWSTGVLLSELFSLYQGTQLPKIHHDFSNYLDWVADQDAKNSVDYWQSYLANIEAPTHLANLYGRKNSNVTALESDQGHVRYNLDIETPTLSLWQAALQNAGLTLNTLIQASWLLTLQRYTGQNNPIFGNTVAGRPTSLENSESMVGLFINTLPVTHSIDFSSNTNDWLNELQSQTSTQREFSYSSLADVQAQSPLDDSNIFDTLMVFENYPLDKNLLKQSGLEVGEPDSYEFTHYPLTLAVLPGDFLRIVFAYDSSHFSKWDIENLASTTNHYLDQLIQHLSQPLSSLSILDERQAQTLNSYHKASEPWSYIPFSQLVSEQAKALPTKEAIVANPLGIVTSHSSKRISLTYSQLDQQSDAVAAHLIELGVKPDNIIGALHQRGTDMLVTMLGILKAGAAFLPLDPDYPKERLAYMLEDSHALSLITDNVSQELANTIYQPEKTILFADIDIQKELKERPHLLPDQLAYVIYTSGSTGKPKGVCVSQLGMSMHVQTIGQRYGMQPNDIELHFASISFDGAIERWSVPLAFGSSLIIRDQQLWSASETCDVLEKEQVSIACFPPSYVGPLLEWIELEQQKDIQLNLNVRSWTLGGEAFTKETYFKLQETLQPRRIINGYGPTETVVTPMIWQAYPDTPLSSAYAPIGNAVGARSLYILDSALQPVPAGVIGELYIGNEAGLARGYLDRPDLTAERFLPDPFSQNGERMYRTGDLVRWRTDGIMEYQGRIDDQIKIRGFRIELGEIESLLQKVSGCKQCAVVAFEQTEGSSLNKYLVGYLESNEHASAPHSDTDLQAILTELGKQLPDYMVPSQLVVMEQLPLTPASKIDKKRLIAPELHAKTIDYVPPKGDMEEQLAEQWQQLFNIEKVSRHDDFFNLGGQSLLATQLVGRLQQQNIHLPLQDVFSASELCSMAAHCTQNQSTATDALTPIAQVPRLDLMPVSTSQKRLWFVQELMPESSAYHMPLGLTLLGQLQLEHLEEALKLLVNRHEILRTSFTQIDGELMQLIHPKLDYTKELPLLSRHHVAEFESIEQQRLEWIGQPFDLTKPRLLRAYIVENSPTQFELLLVIHHIISDGVSMQRFIKELAENYLDIAQDPQAKTVEIALKQPDTQYVDYAHWQQNWLKSDQAQRDLAWWKNTLKSDIEPLVLQSEVSRSDLQTIGKRQHFTLTQQQIEQITSLASAHKTTVFNVMLSLWHLVLHKYSDRKDIRVGIPVAGRSQPATESMQGCFINNLVTSSVFTEETTFSSLLQDIKAFNEQALSRQDVPFEVVVEALGVTGNLQHHPLYQTSFNFQQLDKSLFDLWGDIKAQPFDPGVVAAQLEISLDIQQFSESDWGGFINYTSPVFDENFAASILKHWLILLDQIAIDSIKDNDKKRIAELTLVDKSEQTFISQFNETERSWGQFQSPVVTIIEQAKKTPNAIALSFQNESITYADFDRKVTQLANWLRSQGVKEESRIGLGLPRSIELVIGLHAITRAGAAYVPLDPSYPSDRLLYILESADVPLLLTDTATINQWPTSKTDLENAVSQEDTTKPECRYITIDTLLNEPEVNTQSLVPPSVHWHEELALYAIFTSGSTGLPKGVINHQAALQNRLEWMQDAYQLTDSDCVLQKTPFSFDVSVWEFFWPLMYGARLAIAPPDHHRQPELLHKTIIEQKVSTIHFVPSMLHAFESETDIAACTSLKRIICSGEALPAELVDRVLSQSTSELHNLYGPTEAAIDVSYWQCQQPVGKRTPIGYAINNIQLHVLDSYGNPTPIGLPGELYLAGDGLARGYLGRPDLTAERFLPNPWGKAGSRMYRTGDKVIRMPDGRLEYLDRLDNQVKIRGLRIELEEIENTLNQHPMIEESAVIAHRYSAYATTESSNQSATQLVAYIVSNTWGDELEASIKAHLAQHLPDYMVPAIFIPLDTMPLSPSGKRDRKALPEPTFSKVAYRAPETDLEIWLASTWQTVLDVPQVGLDDNFFALGGHSLLATKIVALAQKDLGLEITLKEFFDANSLQSLADSLNDRYQTENENEQDDLDAMAALMDDLELL
ncbi:amino acid adenylation domain-containing protein [Marinomonas sp. C2222]|uniref:Amino acid adenylation domain-containing protein n=1 Tax=Marinomonas sargassi TaxID=2984494 RepID=A0ABT2YNU6_9GAMM|nr:non-ribosomal peptide synthetase [Marinomonas sargassi]MCV2401573.1 amino acid adenylation domain-containing protein [Marinomonas sargassi]